MSSNDALREEFAIVKEDYGKDTPSQFVGRSAARAVIWDKSSGHCWYCGEVMNPFRDFTVDHMVARKAGGEENFDNLVPACKKCNVVKNNRTVEKFRPLLARRCLRGPGFSEEQLLYLKNQGIDVDELMPIDEFKFYFEKAGL